MKKIILLMTVFIACIFITNGWSIGNKSSKQKTTTQREKMVNNIEQKNASSNLIKNPGAEDGKEWWSMNSCYGPEEQEWGISDKEAHTGKNSVYLKLKTASGAYCCTLIAGKISPEGTAPEGYKVQPNTKYYFSFWIKGSGFSKALIPEIQGYDETGENRSKTMRTVITSEKKVVFPKDTWTQYKGYSVTKETIKRAVIGIFFYANKDKAKEGATYYIDDVYLGLTEPK
ncbi:MAG: hypothetical protein PHE88_10605 [Elusimicrobia bacterium]|nr:hypothetical protein [Elusimicrobiota bacterium]